MQNKEGISKNNNNFISLHAVVQTRESSIRWLATIEDVNDTSISSINKYIKTTNFDDIEGIVMNVFREASVDFSPTIESNNSLVREGSEIQHNIAVVSKSKEVELVKEGLNNEIQELKESAMTKAHEHAIEVILLEEKVDKVVFSKKVRYLIGSSLTMTSVIAMIFREDLHAFITNLYRLIFK